MLNESANDNPQPPPSIPDHELLRRIGGGGYGEVWLARNIMGVYRAVKIVHRDKFAEARPYEREFEGIQNFEPISRRHENQVEILHVGRSDTDDYFYYVMELADNANAESLNAECEIRSAELKTISHSALPIPHSYSPDTLKQRLLQSGHLPYSECLRIGNALAAALAHLHRHDLVHRDVKPSNVIFVNGIPKLADVGLVTPAGDPRSMVGTIGYVAPEGAGRPQADIFSLGRVLHDCAFGMAEQSDLGLPDNLEEMDEQEELIELNEIILKACQHQLNLRYATADDLIQDLEVLQAGQSIRRMRLFERRFAIAKITTAVALLAAVVMGVALVQSRKQARELQGFHDSQLASVQLVDFENGPGEWDPSWSEVSEDEGVEVDEDGHLKLFGTKVRYTPTVDGVVKFSTLEDGRPVEVRVDVLRQTHGSRGGALVQLSFGNYNDDDPTEPQKLYSFGRIADGHPFLWKNFSAFWKYWEEEELPMENVQFVLVATAAGDNLILNARILDLENGRVLFERTVVDTPGQDGIDPAEIPFQAGNTFEDIEAPFLGKHAVRFILNTYGDPAPAEVVIDNFQILQHKAPLIESSALLTFPATRTQFKVLGASEPTGPFEELQFPMNSDGVYNRMEVPASVAERMKFLKLEPVEEPAP